MKIKNTKMVVVILLGIFAMLVSCEKTEVEWGCTDPTASNYYAQAVVDNGNCRYDNDTTTPTNPISNTDSTLVTIREDLPIDVDVTLIITERENSTNNSEYSVGTIQYDSPFNFYINDDYLISRIIIGTNTDFGYRTEEYIIDRYGNIIIGSANNQILVMTNRWIKLSQITNNHYEIISL